MNKLCFIVFAVLWLPHSLSASEGVLSLLKQDGYVALMRHALAPGFGDPDEFSIDDCVTQRNLNDVGRAQAKATGDYFRGASIEFASVYTSEWCRCRETAELLALAPVQPLAVINSFFQDMRVRDERTEALL